MWLDDHKFCGNALAPMLASMASNFAFLTAIENLSAMPYLFLIDLFPQYESKITAVHALDAFNSPPLIRLCEVEESVIFVELS